MTKRKLACLYERKSAIYDDLAARCGSVSELVLKLVAYGEDWTRWDWVLFFSRLHWMKNDGLMSDILETVDAAADLDGVLTDRAVVMSLVESAELDIRLYGGASLRILAHVFKKFPSLWEMNYMWIRRKSGERTSRMLSVVQDPSIKCVGDFVEKYF